MKALIEAAMAQSIGLAIYAGLPSDIDRAARLTVWAANRYGAEWALTRYAGIRELALATYAKNGTR